MNRKILCGALAALMIAGSGSFALAQDATPPTTPAAGTMQPLSHMGKHHMGKERMRGHGDRHHGFRHRHGMHGHARGPGGAVISDLRKLQRLYTAQGKSREMTALYQHVLASTQNQQVRNFAYAQMARAQMRPASSDAAIATLRKSLDENLGALNKRHDRRMQKHAQMDKQAK